MFYTSGVATLLLAFFYATVDWPKHRCWDGGVLRSAGMNAIALYIFQDVFVALIDTVCLGPALPPSDPRPSPPCTSRDRLLGG